MLLDWCTLYDTLGTPRLMEVACTDSLVGVGKTHIDQAIWVISGLS